LDIKRIKEELNELKLELRKQQDTISQRAQMPLAESVGELSSYDNHSSDLAAETFEREKDLGLRDNAKIMLMKVNRALEKIENGTYGRCEKCGKSIEEERLEAIPYALLCINCQKEEEVRGYRRDRPLEEEVLKYPFGRSFLDESGENEYDGEDAWQDVARYGTANSPQDESGAFDYTETYIDGDEQRGVVEGADMIIDEEDLDEDEKNELSE